MKSKIFLFLILIFGMLFVSEFAGAMTEQERLNLIAQIQQQILQIQSQINQISYGGSGWCHDFNYNIKYNSSGSEVRNLHIALKKEGFFISDSEFQNQQFGDTTASAVSAFQEKYRAEVLSPFNLVKPTITAGIYTRNKLNKSYGCAPVCASSWICSDWESCSSGKQKRICKDSSICPFSLDKPVESRSCVVPKVEILGNGKKGKISINSGESVLISWATEGVGSCSASGNWSGIKNVSGSQKTDNLNFSRVYNISCKDASGKVVSASLSVDVAQLKVDIKADNSDGPVTIDPGKAVKLSWTSSGATQCSASGNWSGDKVISGSEYSGYFSYPRDYVYTIYCTGPSGGVQDSVTVNILTPKVDIKVNNSDGPITIDSGKTVRLSWTAVGVSSCTASGDWSGSKKNSGSETTAKIFSSKSYSITCRDVSRESFGDTAVVNIK